MNNKIYLFLILILFGTLLSFRYAKSQDLPDYFICNSWEDKNSDGLLDNDEFIGIKNNFNPDNDTIITFIGYYYDSKGKEIGLKIYEPDGTLYRDKTAEVEYEPTHVHRWWFSPEIMVEDGRAGEWTAKWYFEGELVHTETFTLASQTSSTTTTSKEPDFFACNYWQDLNGDELLDRNEYIEVKNSFSVEDDTTITFVSYWYDSKGKYITIKIYDSKGDLWYTDTAEVEYEATQVQQWNFNVKAMASEGGLGDWTEKWYLNDEYANSITVNIYKKYESTQLFPQFFTCNSWDDKDSNSYIAEDYSEFTGIKDKFVFGIDSKIMFVSHWINKKGMLRKMVIYTPSGTAWKTDTATIKSDEVYWHPEKYVSSMYNQGGVGTWTVKWYLNGELAQGRDFTIAKQEEK